MDEDKLYKVLELQADLLVRLSGSLCDEDQRDVLMVQSKAQAILTGKSTVSAPKKDDQRNKKKKQTRRRGKDRDRERDS